MVMIDDGMLANILAQSFLIALWRSDIPSSQISQHVGQRRRGC